jgi:murein DD-endopeptidase MepM/ murein hydrolase activator NlpD
MTARKDLELWVAPALSVALAVALSACTTSPRSDFAWNLKDRRPKPVQVVEYGPRSVTLPPVAQQRRADSATTLTPQPSPVRGASTAPAPRRTPGWYNPPARSVAPRTDDQPAPRVADASVSFRWPLAGKIVLDYGAAESGERNDGINIAVASGTPVHASAAGTVSYCGNELKGFGNLVLIRHDNGYITAYAHVGSILVSRGDSVSAGQVIATAGATGDVASPQLHFEIRQGVRPINPKSVLPKSLVLAQS